MKTLLAILVLFSSMIGLARSDINIYGPGDVNLGPNGDPEQQYRNEILEKKREQAILEEERNQQEAILEEEKKQQEKQQNLQDDIQRYAIQQQVWQDIRSQQRSEAVNNFNRGNQTGNLNGRRFVPFIGHRFVPRR